MPFPIAAIKTAAEKILANYQTNDIRDALKFRDQLLELVVKTITTATENADNKVVFPTDPAFQDLLGKMQQQGKITTGFELTLYSNGNIQLKSIINGQNNIQHLLPEGSNLAPLNEDAVADTFSAVSRSSSFASTSSSSSKLTRAQIQAQASTAAKQRAAAKSNRESPTGLVIPAPRSATTTTEAPGRSSFMLPVFARPRHLLRPPIGSLQSSSSSTASTNQSGVTTKQWKRIIEVAAAEIIKHARCSDERKIRSKILVQVQLETMHKTGRAIVYKGGERENDLDLPGTFKLTITSSGKISYELAGKVVEVEVTNEDKLLHGLIAGREFIASLPESEEERTLSLERTSDIPLPQMATDPEIDAIVATLNNVDLDETEQSSEESSSGSYSSTSSSGSDSSSDLEESSEDHDDDDNPKVLRRGMKKR